MSLLINLQDFLILMALSWIIRVLRFKFKVLIKLIKRTAKAMDFKMKMFKNLT